MFRDAGGGRHEAKGGRKIERGRRTGPTTVWAEPTGRWTARRGVRRGLRIWLFLLPVFSRRPRRCACYRLRLAGLWVRGGRFHRAPRADYKLPLPRRDSELPSYAMDNQISIGRGAANNLSTRSSAWTMISSYLWRLLATGAVGMTSTPKKCRVPRTPNFQSEMQYSSPRCFPCRVYAETLIDHVYALFSTSTGRVHALQDRRSRFLQIVVVPSRVVQTRIDLPLVFGHNRMCVQPRKPGGATEYLSQVGPPGTIRERVGRRRAGGQCFMRLVPDLCGGVNHKINTWRSIPEPVRSW